MSVLGEQIKELREAARQFGGYQNGEISRMMREAADTIESLQDRLQATVETCELVEVDSYRSDMEIIHVLECSACGQTCEHVNGSYPKCPHCGARAVER